MKKKVLNNFKKEDMKRFVELVNCRFESDVVVQVTYV